MTKEQGTSPAGCIVYLEHSLQERESVKRSLKYRLVIPSKIFLGWVTIAVVVQAINQFLTVSKPVSILATLLYSNVKYNTARSCETV